MKIDLGYGNYLEPDEGPRDTPYHQRIMCVTPIPNTRAGYWLELACGMTDFQTYALSHPLARANGACQQEYHRITFPWSIILTVNK